MSPKKALVLGTLLLLPVLAFLFLKMFGVNRFSLRTYFPATVDSTMVEGQWRYDTTYHQVPDFRLISQNGVPFSQQELEGKIYVANFFDTSCGVPCKQMSTQLSRVQDAFRLRPDVRILSYTIHPEKDTPEVLKQYAESFRAEPTKWIFLTGPKEQLQRVAQAFYLPSQDTSSEQDKRLFLVDKEKQVRGIYNGTDPADVDRLITEINVLLSEYNIDNGK
ncbi:SCO family protein [Rufibacter sp. XAAS-G3-1]|uniref:SCO family protein n=1 Tax=Rufibacter sp. XAAS-G3-1 TaxID=2729134 RepID=UPI0015E72B4B|nr:SCO family protein [Rufibacter sp. XAAS-G3-1]